MIFAIIFYLSACLLGVMVLDATRFTIPNWLNGLLLAAYPVFVAFTPEPVDWLGGLAAAGIMLVIGFLVFAFRVMGGGDAKLLMVAGLWFGPVQIMPFLMTMALLGGALAALLLLMRARLPMVMAWLNKTPENLPRMFRHGEPVPYGLAIAGAWIFMLWTGEMPGVATIF